MKEERDVIGLTLTLSTNHDPATQINLQINYTIFAYKTRLAVVGL